MPGRLVSRVVRVLYWVVVCALVLAAAMKFTPAGVMRPALIAGAANAIRFLPYVAFALMLVLQLAPEGRRPEFTKDRAFGDVWAGIFVMLATIWTFNLYNVGNPAFTTLETEWPIGIVLINLALFMRIGALLWYRARARTPQPQ